VVGVQAEARYPAADRMAMGASSARARWGEFPWGEGYEPGFANINETYQEAGPHNLSRTSAVGIYPQGASAEGVLDLAGNVWEWCLNEYEKPERIQAAGTQSRVLRGGGWSSYRHDARAGTATATIGQPFLRRWFSGGGLVSHLKRRSQRRWTLERWVAGVSTFSSEFVLSVG
jgi:Sulfatase-modifying factor enzyme 1